jgi:predicted phosphodiesterase
MKATMNPKIFFLGDVHGRFDHVFQTVEQHRPDAVIFLGDIEAPFPFLELLAPILAKTVVRYIHGNHDTDNDRYYDYLFKGKAGALNLHGRVEEICGVKIAGLGGVFRESVWMPPAQHAFSDYDSYLTNLRKKRPSRDRLSQSDLFLSQQERRHHSTIFPEVFLQLSLEFADVLVTHEAPSCHPLGFETLDRLARAMGVAKAFHGHHHDRRDYSKYWQTLGFQSHGVGFRGITDLAGNVILPGQYD